MFKRSELFEVKIGEDSFITNKENKDYYESLGFLDEYRALEYFRDYVWIEENSNQHDSGFLLCLSTGYYSKSGLKDKNNNWRASRPRIF